MDYVKLGNTGLDVSRLCLGTMGFGDPERWIHPWVLGEDAARPVIQHALDAGINFFDTANVYSIGRSEEHPRQGPGGLREPRRDRAGHERWTGRMHEGPNGQGLSRKAILSEVDKSLERLGTDYIDLYIIHRWDYTVPIEETMRALDDVVRSGEGPPHRRLRDVRLAVPAGPARRRGGTAGRRSSPCRTTTTSCTARRSGR